MNDERGAERRRSRPKAKGSKRKAKAESGRTRARPKAEGSKRKAKGSKRKAEAESGRLKQRERSNVKGQTSHPSSEISESLRVLCDLSRLLRDKLCETQCHRLNRLPQMQPANFKSLFLCASARKHLPQMAQITTDKSQPISNLFPSPRSLSNVAIGLPAQQWPASSR